VLLSGCLEAINAKLAHRGKTLHEVQRELQMKEARLKKTWETRLSAQMTSLPKFDNVYRAVKRAFRVTIAGLFIFMKRSKFVTTHPYQYKYFKKNLTRFRMTNFALPSLVQKNLFIVH
jgi:hypothetical protein